MDSPIQTVYDSIQSKNYPWLDELYQGGVPQETEVDGTETICAIQYVSNTLNGYVNNKFSRLNFEIEVQIFFATNFSGTYGTSMDCALDLVCGLQDEGWHVSAPYPDSIDPDTSQLTKTYVISKSMTYERKNE